MGKATVSNISVTPWPHHHPKSPCYGLFVGCGSPGCDPSFSRLAVLSAYTVTATQAGTLLLQHPLCSSDPSLLMLSRGIALPPCLLSNAFDQFNYQRDRMFMVTNVGPQVQWFSPFSIITQSSPSGPVRPFQIKPYFCFKVACRRVWVSLLYVSMNCLRTGPRYMILGASRGGLFLWMQGV